MWMLWLFSHHNACLPHTCICLQGCVSRTNMAAASTYHSNEAEAINGAVSWTFLKVTVLFHICKRDTTWYVLKRTRDSFWPVCGDKKMAVLTGSTAILRGVCGDRNRLATCLEPKQVAFLTQTNRVFVLRPNPFWQERNNTFLSS